MLRSGRIFGHRPALFVLIIAGCAVSSALAKEPKQHASPAEKKEDALINLPLPVGHEAKGLVLPDFGFDGKLRGRFEAGSAKRIDEGHVAFTGLNIQTFNEENAPEMSIKMTQSTLDLKTRVLTSNERTTVHRADFEIAGDSMEFNTITRVGTLAGNVKMVITDQSHLVGQKPE